MHKKETYDPNAGKPYLHPGRQANIIYDGTVVGYLGEVHPDVADIYGIGTKAYVAVLDMPEITERASFDRNRKIPGSNTRYQYGDAQRDSGGPGRRGDREEGRRISGELCTI